MIMKKFYVWIGQNASTGTPNRLTGRLSMYGRYMAFKSDAYRNEYIDQWRSYNPSEYIVKCNISTGRQYSLGDTLKDYVDYMENVAPLMVKIINTETGRETWESYY